MIIQSDLLGPLTVDPSEIFRFPVGLFGFPDSHDFVLLPAEQQGLYWLQSSEHTALTFLLVDPFIHFDDYSVDITPAELSDLGDPSRSELVVLAIVTLPRTAEASPTANLQGPVALNVETRLAKQVPLAESGFGVQSPFSFPAG